jgi:hypothetical protein
MGCLMVCLILCIAAARGDLIVLDAKYRVNNQLDDAIASLHMYRDALVQSTPVDDGIERIVRGAYLLTPHTPTYDASWKTSDMPGRLFHPDYRGTFKFGAAQLRPGMKLKEVEDVFTKLLADSGASV